MTPVAAQNPVLDFAVSIPKVGLKRLKGLVKAMGWSFEKIEKNDKELFSQKAQTRFLPSGRNLIRIIYDVLDDIVQVDVLQIEGHYGDK